MQTQSFFDINSYGVKGDGLADDTAAIQSALNAVAAQGGGMVCLPAGRYVVGGSLTIPVGVTLQGVAESPQYIEPLTGTVVLATGGHGNEQGSALFELGDSSAVRGITVYYPNQKLETIVPYPWTFHLVGGDNTVENVTLINSYNGIEIGPEPNVRHRIRSVVGCVLRTGIWLDNTTDIGRIDNVQWHAHWWSSAQVGGNMDKVFEYMWKHCEAFVFGRTDWEFVNNTFIWPVNIGYRFIQTPNGAMNGQLCGIGADAAQICVLVEHIQPMGLLITNGQFVSFTGDKPIEVILNDTCEGSVRFVNCAFWGSAIHNVVSHSPSFTSFNDCYFSKWPEKGSPDPLVVADNGKLQIRGCSFGTPEMPIHLKKGVKHAIIAENNGVQGVGIINEAGDVALIVNNEPAA